MLILWINFKVRTWKPYYWMESRNPLKPGRELGRKRPAGVKMMKSFLRREALLTTVVFFAAALVLAACNHQSGEGGPKTTPEYDKDQGNGNGGGGGGY